MANKEILMIRIHNMETGEIIDRPMNEDEITQLEEDRAKIQENLALKETKEITKQIVLDKLGLTAEEAAALLG